MYVQTDLRGILGPPEYILPIDYVLYDQDKAIVFPLFLHNRLLTLDSQQGSGASLEFFLLLVLQQDLTKGFRLKLYYIAGWLLRILRLITEAPWRSRYTLHFPVRCSRVLIFFCSQMKLELLETESRSHDYLE